jgi:hypothetical protein
MDGPVARRQGKSFHDDGHFARRKGGISSTIAICTLQRGKSFHHDREKAPFQGEVTLFNPVKHSKTERVRRWPHTGRRKVDKGGIVSTIGRRKTPGMGVNPSTIYAAACFSLLI